ncbi:hypothetical protein [Oceanispirochaeta sp.]|jgi:hypothetical protein|uniref:hypothetical protein n=1 Tax=Oceanispirochaeta sp. TaxID=2035350 RepID=UPI002615F528|nr:hypothetical protein [Oceanispirochaeta sp.]MDA3958178.1 hypothetical protein [Oceanispirochaeta sp.]
MNKYFLLVLLVPVLFFSCDMLNDSGSDDFELIGSWVATDVVVDVASGTKANITTNITQTTFTSKTVIQPAGSETYRSEGELTSFNNEKNCYIAKVTSSDTPNMIGMYGRTEYELASDGSSFTGDSYSYETTEEAAKDSKTVQLTGIVCIKQ